MGVTYTSALTRDARQRVLSARRFGEQHLILALTSLVAVLAIALACSGRLASRPQNVTTRGTQRVVNLNTVVDANALTPVLAPVFQSDADRAFAAAHLMTFIEAIRASGREVPNTGAILGATAPTASIDRTRGLVTFRERLQTARDHAAERGVAPPATLPLFSAEDLAALKPSLIVRTSEAFVRRIAFWTALYVFAFWAIVALWWARGFSGDGTLLVAAHVLTAVGVAILVSRPDPLRDTILVARFVQGIGIGLALFAAASLVNVRRAAFLTLSYIPLVLALALSVLLLLFGSGPGGSNAKVNLGPVQPIEAIRLLLALFLAGYFARRWEVLRQVRGVQFRAFQIPRWWNMPRVDFVLPVLVGVGAALVFFFLQKDLGPALFVACVFLIAYSMARNRVGMAVLGFALLVGGFYVGYALDISATLAARVHMWQSPWDNAVRGGDQIAQSIWALSTGGLFGTGLGLGDSRYLPAGHTDLVLAAIGEELGLAGLVAVGGVFVVIARRGLATALRAANDYGYFLATTLTVFLVLPVLVMAAGMLGVVPLTGVVTPFLSYGGSAMAANFTALGLLAAIRADSPQGQISQPFQRSTRWLGVSFAAAAIGLAAILVNVQVVRADHYLVKPHLGLQADGVRRFQYNQRVLDMAGLIPRGTIYDRHGVPLATSDDAVTRRAREVYRAMGLAIDRSCTAPAQERCYPLGGAAFHLLGDANTRRNWAAGNSSYVERDLQDRLRGFDDRAVSVATVDRAGRTVPAIRRDYRDLVPLVRHRYQPDHPAVKALLGRDRDITLTIDARFQADLASILTKAAAKSGTGQAAAVVIDPASGELLASASYPYPRDTTPNELSGSSMYLDRARYGLYPPGSTFKVITAAAALRQDPLLSRATFACSRLPDGRVGATLPRWGVVRDDVLDKAPHGTIGMHDALTHSCNAYFAQLAVRLGPQALLDASEILGISVARDNPAARLRATLPYAGYGQGDVVATPLRMARTIAAIVENGELRDVSVQSQPTARRAGSAFVDPRAAALLRQYLRDAVVAGTGKGLRAHPWRIAGKTGTAEVTGAPSHAWFVGFAPFGQATKRVAFAVVVENAGYGGLAAAPAAGEIVTAAAVRGLVR